MAMTTATSDRGQGATRWERGNRREYRTNKTYLPVVARGRASDLGQQVLVPLVRDDSGDAVQAVARLEPDDEATVEVSSGAVEAALRALGRGGRGLPARLLRRSQHGGDVLGEDGLVRADLTGVEVREGARRGGRDVGGSADGGADGGQGLVQVRLDVVDEAGVLRFGHGLGDGGHGAARKMRL